MPNKDAWIVPGTILKEHRGNFFEVELENGHVLLCRPNGRMVKNKIRCIAGDAVDIEMCEYDLSKGRIVFRHK